MNVFASTALADEIAAETNSYSLCRKYLSWKIFRKYLYNRGYKQKIDARLAERPCIRLQMNFLKRKVQSKNWKTGTGRREFNSPTSLFLLP
ncbi:MAG: hypothetical protein B6U68_03435 [Candidatus Aenigmarchaeota archaeon ex4484_14]|nr:MAG: hypothetical protein B6U68_03435 [Candidatus Aenigmarchaeota archaeon ex4484_14]